ncbi:MAG TPA: right-handed parallel beta-helix repeat-containing protein, partial [Thermoplasmata archaeon]|nr:right-handed parallel beta-helix repeat-containing protein [Thermoplasmata archaeon]
MVLLAPERPSGVLTLHAPIEIIGDSQFTSANGVVSGKGTSVEPYLIAGWEILAPPGVTAVRMSGTTRAVEVRDCKLVSDGAPALMLSGSRNVQMVGLDISGGVPAVSVSGSDSISVRDSTVASPVRGARFDLNLTSNVTVDRNRFQAVGLAVHGGTGVLVTRNHLSGASTAIELGDGSAAVVRNLIEGAGVGVLLQSGAHRIESNFFERGQTSVQGKGGAGSLVLENTFDRTQGSAVVLGTGIASVEVAGNDFLGPRGAAPWAQDSSPGSKFSNSTTGNYWSDWTTPDSNGDGIVDSPRSIKGSANSSDLLPRVSAFGNWDPSPPSAPVIVGLEEIDLNGTAAVSLRWDLPASDLPLTQYVVMRGRNASSLVPLAALPASQGAEFVDSGVFRNVTY